MSKVFCASACRNFDALVDDVRRKKCFFVEGILLIHFHPRLKIENLVEFGEKFFPRRKVFMQFNLCRARIRREMEIGRE